METRARYTLMGLFAAAVIFLIFAFIYWLDAAGGLGKRSAYMIRFEGPVAGLLRGSAVLFNGVRVGEVASLSLLPDRPQEVLVEIDVDQGTPVRSDTKVTIDFQGISGHRSSLWWAVPVGFPCSQADAERNRSSPPRRRPDKA